MAPDHRSRGEFVGLYLSACAKMYASTGDERVKEQANQVVADQQQLADVLNPVSGPSSNITVSPEVLRLFDSSYSGEVTLQPRHRVHGSRAYVVSWDSLTAAQLQAREQEEARLAALLVDRVFPANEWSERDHNVRGERTVAGQGRWRHATEGGWFAWELNSLPDTPLALRVTYWGGDAGGREFDVLVDGQLAATQKLEHNRPGVFCDETYRLPPELTQGKQKLTVKFQAHPGKTAGGVFGCTLLKVHRAVAM